MLHKSIKNWLSAEEIEMLEAEGTNRGICHFYATLNYGESQSVDGFSSFKSWQWLLKNYGADRIDQRQFRSKIQFYIDYLRAESYLEIAPNLSYKKGRVETIDYLLTCRKVTSLNADSLLAQSIEASTEAAINLLQDNYQIDNAAIERQIHAENADYITYIPYYYLMEAFRTSIDRSRLTETGGFQTIRRDKQLFLNKVYLELIKRKKLSFSTAVPSFQKLHQYFPYAYFISEKNMAAHQRHYQFIFSYLVETVMQAKDSVFHIETIEDERIKKFYAMALNSDTINYTTVFNLAFSMLEHFQSTLLTAKINRQNNFRLVRNILLELFFHSLTFKRWQYHQSNVALEKLNETMVGCSYLIWQRLDDTMRSQLPELDSIRLLNEFIVFDYLDYQEGRANETQVVCRRSNLQPLFHLATQKIKAEDYELFYAIEKKLKIIDGINHKINGDLYLTHMRNAQLILKAESGFKIKDSQHLSLLDLKTISQGIKKECLRLDHHRDDYHLNETLKKNKEHLSEIEFFDHLESLPKLQTQYEKRETNFYKSGTDKIEHLKRTLANPANYNALFTGSSDFYAARHSFQDLFNSFLLYRNHFMAIFPKMKKVLTAKKQFRMLMSSFCQVGLLVHVVIEAQGEIFEWYVEGSFWRLDQARFEIKQQLTNEYAYCQNNKEKALLHGWLDLLPLSLAQVNQRSRAGRQKSKNAKALPVKANV